MLPLQPTPETVEMEYMPTLQFFGRFVRSCLLCPLPLPLLFLLPLPLIESSRRYLASIRTTRLSRRSPTLSHRPFRRVSIRSLLLRSSRHGSVHSHHLFPTDDTNPIARLYLCVRRVGVQVIHILRSAPITHEVLAPRDE